MPVLVAFAGMVGEYGYGLVLKSEDQRVADLTAYSAALAYSATPTTAALQSAANSAAALNGLSAAQLATSLVNSPSGDGNPAVLVTVSTVQPLLLTQLISRAPSFTIQASAYAEIKGAAACILALNQSGSGVTLSGSATVKAPGCAVASNSTVTLASCGNTITTSEVDYDSGSPPGCGIVGPNGSSATITKGYVNNPFANNSSVQASPGSVSTASNLTSPAGPSASGAGLPPLGYSPNTFTVSLVGGGSCNGALSGSTWTINCSGATTYNLGSLSFGSGGLSVQFNTLPGSTYNFNGGINNNSGSGTLTFGAGTYNIGPMTTTCGKKSGATYSICNGGATMTFLGPSTFNIAAGVYTGGGASTTLGTGSANSFNIGPGSDGNAINAGGGAQTMLGDATGSGDVFDVVGNIVNSGGGCTVLSAAAQHDINGSLSAAGAIIMGSGVYVVSGYVALGASNGGDEPCNGLADVGLLGNGVSFVLGGNTTPSLGNCNGQVFCVGAGYGNVTLTAPTSGQPNAGFLVIGPASASNTAGALFTAGATNNSLSGVFYIPNGSVTLNGGAGVGDGGGPGSCLQLVGSQVTLSNGTSLASACTGVGQTNITTVQVVQ